MVKISEDAAALYNEKKYVEAELYELASESTPMIIHIIKMLR